VEGNHGAAQRAYQLLRRDIVAGEIRAGSRLAETDLAEQYGLSRTPIREALRRLQSEGLVEVTPNRGARVIDWHNFDVEGIYDLREALEAFVTRRAATRITPEKIAELSQLCDEMEHVTSVGAPDDPGTITAFAELNAQFHGSIAEAADAPYAVPGRNVVVVLPLILQALHQYSPPGYSRSNRHHRELLDAFVARDPDWAERIMRTHVVSSKSGLMRRLRPSEG
jgi:DNA-binding GntR family transcriptional regulator